jgi:hypothetical protein
MVQKATAYLVIGFIFEKSESDGDKYLPVGCMEGDDGFLLGFKQQLQNAMDMVEERLKKNNENTGD